MEHDKHPRQIVQTEYHAYLLRLWRESPGGAWRAMLQDVATGRRHGFAGLVTLWTFLRAEIGESTSCSGEPAPPGRETAVNE